MSVFSFQLVELLTLLILLTLFSLSEKKQKNGKRSFAESLIGTTEVAEVSEEAVKYQRAVTFAGICS